MRGCPLERICSRQNVVSGLRIRADVAPHPCFVRVGPTRDLAVIGCSGNGRDGPNRVFVEVNGAEAVAFVAGNGQNLVKHFAIQAGGHRGNDVHSRDFHLAVNDSARLDGPGILHILNNSWKFRLFCKLCRHAAEQHRDNQHICDGGNGCRSCRGSSANYRKATRKHDSGSNGNSFYNFAH